MKEKKYFFFLAFDSIDCYNIVNRIGKLSLRTFLMAFQIQESWENSSISGSDVSSFTGNPRILVNIWIPSVFLTGTGSSKHHLYQVSEVKLYIRIQYFRYYM